MRIEELKQKEVINTCNCKILGCADDIEFDICTGCIEAIIVPGPGKYLGCFCRDYEYCIPWVKIVKIGPDIILVDICENDMQRKI